VTRALVRGSKSRTSAASQQLVPVEVIERRILLIRGHKVMLDRDLAALYACEKILATNMDLAERLAAMENKYDQRF
jgi:hypothetical protein